MATSTSSTTIELSHLAPHSGEVLKNLRLEKPTSPRPSLGSFGRRVGSDLPSPVTATEQPSRWNHPRSNLFRVLACFWGFLIMGANDGAVGALIPYLESYYGLSYTVVSLVFLSPLFGYATSALLNDRIHMRFGQRGVAIVCSLCHLAAYTVACVHPPYPVLVVIYILAGFGNGLEDAAWNAWIGDMANSNEIMGFLHGFYGLGATIAPLIATSMITKGGLPWWTFYYLMVGFALVELVAGTASFWQGTGTEFRRKHPRTTNKNGGRMKEAVASLPAARTTWIVTLFLFVYMGVEVGIGGWIVTFMTRERGASPFASGMTATGFWLGLTLGRVILGFITPKIGEKIAVLIYVGIIILFALIFWLVPQFYVSAIAVGLEGFFLGPLFPCAIVVATKILPKHLHVSAIGFGAAIGGAGSAAFPFAVGAIAQSKGVKVLQPIVLACLIVDALLWCCLPKIERKED